MHELILNDVETFTNITLMADNFLSENFDLFHSIQSSGLVLLVEVAEDEVVGDRRLDYCELLQRLRETCTGSL